MNRERKLYRDTDPVVSGVCGGIARRLGVDPVLIRILMVMLTLVSCGFFAFFYLAFWAVLPTRVVSAPIETGSVWQGGAPWQNGNGAGNPPAVLYGLAVWLVSTACCMLFSQLVLHTLFEISWWQVWPLSFVNLGLVCIFLPGAKTKPLAHFVAGFVLVVVGVVLMPFSVGLFSWLDARAAFADLWPLSCIALGFFLLSWGKDSAGWAISGALVLTIMAMIVVLLCGAASVPPVEDEYGPAMYHEPVYSKAPLESGALGGDQE